MSSAKIFNGTEGDHKGPPLALRVEKFFLRKEGGGQTTKMKRTWPREWAGRWV